MKDMDIEPYRNANRPPYREQAKIFIRGLRKLLQKLTKIKRKHISAVKKHPAEAWVWLSDDLEKVHKMKEFKAIAKSFGVRGKSLAYQFPSFLVRNEEDKHLIDFIVLHRELQNAAKWSERPKIEKLTRHGTMLEFIDFEEEFLEKMLIPKWKKIFQKRMGGKFKRRHFYSEPDGESQCEKLLREKNLDKNSGVGCEIFSWFCGNRIGRIAKVYVSELMREKWSPAFGAPTVKKYLKLTGR